MTNNYAQKRGMNRIVDLTETDTRPAILTSTALGGRLLGAGKILSTDPLETYLSKTEVPKYAVRNKKAGIEIKRNGQIEQIQPDETLQSVCLVTDLRILFVVGREGGDEVVEISLSEIVEAKTEQGWFRSTTLIINTMADEEWRFACKGNLKPVASTVDELAQVWTHSQRLLDEVEAQVSEAKSALNEKDIEQARSELGDADKTVEKAVSLISEAGPAATEVVESRAEDISSQLVEVTREVTAFEGARAHAQAQENWSQRTYESAAQQYERAIERYRTTLSMTGMSPSKDVLERRLRGAVREREILRVGPLLDADSERRRAINEKDPEEAAVSWEVALDGYREMLSLDWGKETREFVVDRDKIRTQTVSIADDAIEDHIAAGRRWVLSGDRLAVDGHDKQAKEVFERARSQFERAEQIANEVRPEQLRDIEAMLTLVEERLSGTVPDEVPETLEFGRMLSGGRNANDSTGLSNTDSGGTTDVGSACAQDGAPSDDETGAESGDSQIETEGEDEKRSEKGSVLDEIRAQKRQGDS